MTNFGGWVMPLQYSTIREEHHAVREAVGLFDLSHMGELRIGDETLIQRVLSRDVTRLRPGRIQYAVLCNDAGGIIDDVLVYAMPDRGYRWWSMPATRTATSTGSENTPRPRTRPAISAESGR